MLVLRYNPINFGCINLTITEINFTINELTLRLWQEPLNLSKSESRVVANALREKVCLDVFVPLS